MEELLIFGLVIAVIGAILFVPLRVLFLLKGLRENQDEKFRELRQQLVKLEALASQGRNAARRKAERRKADQG